METKVQTFDQVSFVSKKAPQFLAACPASLAILSLGSIIAWSAPAIPDIVKTGVLGTLSLSDTSWLVSISTLGAVFSGPFAGYSIEKFGRRFTVLILCFPLTLGWLIICFSKSVNMMCLGRFITGFCMGASTLVTPVYLAEIAEVGIRGLITSVSSICCGLGILLTYVAGTYVSWFTLSLLNVFIPVVMFIFMYFVPESPIYLLGIGQKKKAGKALQWLRGATDFCQIEEELNKMQDAVEGSADVGPVKIFAVIKSLLTRNALKPLGLSLVLMILQQFSGINAVLCYTIVIFESAGTNIDPNLQSIIVGIVIIFAVTMNSLLIDRAGRRVCLLISETGISVCLITLGIYFYVKETNNTPPAGLSWLPLTSLIFFVIVYNLGIGPIAWLMMGELLPSNIKGTASALATSFNWLLAFIVTKTFEDLTLQLGTYGCYWLFGGIGFAGMLFVFFLIPETKGMTLDEIQKQYFSEK